MISLYQRNTTLEFILAVYSPPATSCIDVHVLTSKTKLGAHTWSHE